MCMTLGIYSMNGRITRIMKEKNMLTKDDIIFLSKLQGALSMVACGLSKAAYQDEIMYYSEELDDLIERIAFIEAENN